MCAYKYESMFIFLITIKGMNITFGGRHLIYNVSENYGILNATEIMQLVSNGTASLPIYVTINPIERTATGLWNLSNMSLNYTYTHSKVSIYMCTCVYVNHK